MLKDSMKTHDFGYNNVNHYAFKSSVSPTVVKLVLVWFLDCTVTTEKM